MSGRMPEIQGGMSSDSAGGWDTLRFAATMYAVCRARVSAGRGRLPGTGVCRARGVAGRGCLPGAGRLPGTQIPGYFPLSISRAYGPPAEVCSADPEK